MFKYMKRKEQKQIKTKVSELISLERIPIHYKYGEILV